MKKNNNKQHVCRLFIIFSMYAQRIYGIQSDQIRIVDDRIGFVTDVERLHAHRALVLSSLIIAVFFFFLFLVRLFVFMHIPFGKYLFFCFDYRVQYTHTHSMVCCV